MNERAFLLNIIENPKEDGPRLVFADWLEEQGEVERAEFIRLSIRESELERCENPQVCYHGNSCEHPKTCRYGDFDESRVICGELLRNNEKAWSGIKNRQEIVMGWRRGFLSEVSLTEADFLSCAPQLCWHPIEKVNLTDKEPMASVCPPEFLWASEETGTVARCVLKFELFRNVVSTSKKVEVIEQWSAYFPSKEKAEVALQDACLSYLNSLRSNTPCIQKEASLH